MPLAPPILFAELGVFDTFHRQIKREWPQLIWLASNGIPNPDFDAFKLNESTENKAWTNIQTIAALGDLFVKAVSNPMTATVLTPVYLVGERLNCKDSLHTALRSYGINVPPALGITSGKSGYELGADHRNVTFQTC